MTPDRTRSTRRTLGIFVAAAGVAGFGLVLQGMFIPAVLFTLSIGVVLSAARVARASAVPPAEAAVDGASDPIEELGAGADDPPLGSDGGGDVPPAPPAASSAAPVDDGPRIGPASFDGLSHRGPVALAEVRGRPLELYRVGDASHEGAVAAVRFAAPLSAFRLAYATVDAARLDGSAPAVHDGVGRARIEATPTVRDALDAAGLARWLVAHAGPEPDGPGARPAVVRADGSVLVLFHPSGDDKAAIARLVQMIDDLVEVVERLPPAH
ncbi:MAG TPA: hypothetical protein VK866_07790 [Acidimicrobiales bacterium]|nr:hypothetical protein [Acidimicrobiales bacterium]